MTNLLLNHNLMGLAIGAMAFITIGVFHPVVIKCHYHFGTTCWWWFLILGLIACGASVAVSSTFWSATLAVAGFSSFWTIKEIFDQEKRVARGWFPSNPRRKKAPISPTKA
ncbi:MAG: DUF4491 family protein [Pseudoflavonifractor sp.]|nr:DUF4491 family protein [Alloprevotella sp.]MCM1116116.1 DUF4491 family protein [Pseudoflavonifractor sp.]